MLKLLFQCLAKLPLPFLHALSAGLANIAFYCIQRDKNRIREHLAIAQLPHDDEMVKRVLTETIKSGSELAIACYQSPEHIVSLFQAVHGWHYVEEALSRKQGLLFITPHLGSYDLAGRYISERLPFALTAMYKPSKFKAINDIMQEGRQRGKGKTAPTNLQGVRQVMKALRQGEATIILPDHVPNPKEGEGVWVKFFQRDALTMTLVGKLAQIDHVCPLFFVGERLARGQGFVLHIAPLSGSLNGEKAHDAQLINDNIEAWIRRFPTQYLFAYNRYKNPTPSFRQPEAESAEKAVQHEKDKV